MNFDCLNRMVEYIEDNLDNKIDFNELSKITSINLFILERIFVFLTNMTIVEYIKKRRLSKAFEDIRNTDSKIIDIAFKYQYNSVSSFNRAFKKLFNITPTECRKGLGSYKIIPIEYFENSNNNYNFDYEIKNLPTTILYGYHITATNTSDLLPKINLLYKDSKVHGYYDEFNKIGMYGVFSKKENLYHYYLGTTKYFPDLEKFNIEKNDYAVFKLNSRSQKDIVNLEKRINKQWIPSTNYHANDSFKIEFYKDNYCYIYLPIK